MRRLDRGGFFVLGSRLAAGGRRSGSAAGGLSRKRAGPRVLSCAAAVGNPANAAVQYEETTMRGLVRCAAVLAVLGVAGSALGLETAMQYAGTNGTWDEAANWQELVPSDPSNPASHRVLDPNSRRVPANWEAPGGKNILDPNSWRDESAYLSSGHSVTLNSHVSTISKLYVGPYADTIRDYSVGDPCDPNWGIVNPTGQAATLVIEPGANIYLNRVDETNPGDATVDVVFGQESAYGAQIIQTGGRVSTVFTHICQDAAANVSDGLRPAQGTVTYAMSGGTLQSRFKMYVGESLAVSTGGSPAWGYFDMTDGLVTVGNTGAGGEFGVGYNGRGTFTIAGGTLSTVTGSRSAGLVVGSGSDPNEVATGTMTQSGGTVTASKYLLIGRGHGVGVYSISGGLLRIGTTSGEHTHSDIGLGASGGEADGTLQISGGRVEMLGNKTLRVGNSNLSYQAARGAVKMTGGTFVIASSATESVLVGYHFSLGDPCASTGVLEVTGGSFHAAGRVSLGINKGDATLVVGKDATFKVGSLTTNNNSYAGGTVTIGLELGGADNFSRIALQGGTADLRGDGDRLIEMITTGYRPKEGDSFEVISGAGGTVTGSPTQITTNISLAPQHTDPNDPNSPLLPFFAGAPVAHDPSTHGYALVFQGLTAGDANGDHKVDGGDLALMGGNWMQGGGRPLPGDANLDDIVNGGDLALMGGAWMMSGQDWGHGNFNGDPNGMVDGGDLALMGGNWMGRTKTWGDCDFSGDGKIDGGDLALMGGNWMWTLPPAPPQGAPLPEPATLVLLTLGAVAMLRRKR